MFIDEVQIEVEAGRGGDGCMAFRREKYISMGGPYGGSGGRGADIIFKADEGLKTLIDLRYQKKIKGEAGEAGQGKNKNGKYATNKVVKVPLGTTIKDEEGNVLADLTHNNEEVTIAYGGRGGRGNVSLATKANPCPSFCERGEPGEIKTIKVELRMIADVGLVGMPSVGKSTILSKITNASPKIASYHFTTLSPNLGVVKVYDDSFILADLPGLIEGASNGAGLGHKFLKHVERTKIIAHVIDISASEGRDPYEDYLTIRKELENFSPKLASKKEIIIASKIDLPNSKENLDELKKKIPDKEILAISSLTGENLDILIKKLNQLVKEVKDEPLYEEEKVLKHVLYKFKEEKPFTIDKEGNTYIIKGDKVEKIFKMINFNTEEAIPRFSKRLRTLGIEDALEEMGIKEGDIVRVLDYEFEYTK